MQRLIYWKDTEVSPEMKITKTNRMAPESMGTKNEDSPVASLFFFAFFLDVGLLLSGFLPGERTWSQ